MSTVAFLRTRILSVLVVSALTIVSSAPAFAQRVNGVGGPCTKAGATSKVGTTMLKCDKVNKKLVWVSMGGTTNSKTTTNSKITTTTSKTTGAAAATGNFLVANPIDLQHVVRLSKFRSCVGHDYSPGILEGKSGSVGSLESKRSMKHYVIIDVPVTPARSVNGYAPFDGVIKYDTNNSTMGIGVSVVSSNGWVFEFMHVDPLVADGAQVKAGAAIIAAPANNAAAAAAAKNSSGTPTGGSTTNVFDMALYTAASKPVVLESPFQHFAANVASLWAAKGFTSATAIISKDSRDAAPCTVDGSWNGNFVGQAPESDYVNAIGYTP